MRVLFVITRSDVIGGASVHLLDLARGVQDEGHNVIIVVGGDGVFFEKAAERGLSCISSVYLVREINLLKDIRCFFELRRIFFDFKPDVIHAHSSKAGILGRLVAANLSIPCVFTAHGWAFTEGVSSLNRVIYRSIERFVARFSKKIITVSDYDRSLALREGVANSSLIETIHNGVPPGGVLDKFENFNRSPGIVKLIMVARFDEPKNQELLIRALSRLERSDWVLEFVGDGPSKSRMEELVSSFGLVDKIVFSGACFDVSIRLKNSDIFCLLSDWEGLPLTILEAMQEGLPVIASAVGGIPEAVEDKKSGLLVKKNDVLNLVSAIELLLTDVSLRKSMGAEGRKKFNSEFTLDIMLKKTLGVYDEVLSQ